MDTDDIIYFLILISSIGFGIIYKNFKPSEHKKVIGTVVGLLIVFFVSGFHVIHIILTFLVNSIIILYVNKRLCHIMSFTFSFLYLIFFRSTMYFGIPYPHGHTNIVQMMLTLKLLGLAFDVNTNVVSKSLSADKTSEDKSNNVSQICFSEIFHYSFNYIGVLTGPYYRYRTFKDYFELPYSDFIDTKEATFKRLKFVPLYAVLFLFSSYMWPLSYAKSDEFYNTRSWLYRLWYIWPNFFTFRMRMYSGLVLSECVCIMAGLGAYPTKMEPKAGLGPSKEFSWQDEIFRRNNSNELKKVEYDFETVNNMNPYGSDFCPTMRESMKHWNKCIQYWLAVNIYKRFPYKRYRTLATMLVSAIWHGVYLGYYVCICSVPFLLPLEDALVDLIDLKNRRGTQLKLIEWFLVFFKMFFFSYFAIAFHLLHVGWIIHYYNSVYHFGAIIGVVLYVIFKKCAQIKRRQENIKKNIS